MLRLDFAIFGNGRGLKAPYFSQRFYWLVDPRTGRGTFYTWVGGFGAQLSSFQWTHPRAGESRYLSGMYFKPFCSSRQWFRVRVSWYSDALFSMAEILKFESTLAKGVLR